ncbi:MAG: Rieske 2Fe-2S domain-containing protein [Deferrisomatales bacterium]
MNDRCKKSRRRWLLEAFLYGTIGTTLASLGWALLDVWLAAGRFSSARWVDVARIGEIPAEGVVAFPAVRAAVIRKGHRLGAISLECTHLGCLVNVSDRGFLCPCHGSEFGPLGEVYTPPATQPLPWHDLEIRRGSIRIHTGRKRRTPRWIRIDAAAEA